MIDRAVRRVERLPGTALPWIVAVSVLLGILAHAPAWARGELPVGTFVFDAFSPVIYLTYFLCLIAVLDRIAWSAFEDFRVALDVGDEEASRLRDELTSIPDRLAVGGMVVLAMFFSIGYTLDPGIDEPMPASLEATSGALWLLTILAVAMVVVHTIQQLRLVERLHASARHVDLLQPGPVHALSRLTAATAIGIMIIGILFAAPDTDPEGRLVQSTFGIVAGLAFAALAIVSFGLPLAGMHGRLAAEKARLMNDVNERLKVVLGRIHATVDADDLARADELQKTQSALLAERELYLRLSTYPWSTGTFRGIASAILLPILIGVILRFVARVV
jgi:hypothetical protein